MNALREYLSPNAKKKQRANQPDNDEEAFKESENEMDEVVEEESPPKWAAQQTKLMREIKEMMTSFSRLQQEVKDVKNEIDHAKLQASMAQCSAEEAVDIATNVENRVKAL